MKNIHRQKIMLIAISCIGCISGFLPWLKNQNGITQTGIQTGLCSWLAIVALLLLIAICTYGDKEKPLSGTFKYIALLLSGITALIGILKVFNVIGIGLILLQICSIASFFIILNISRKKDDGIKEIKKINNE